MYVCTCVRVYVCSVACYVCVMCVVCVLYAVLTQCYDSLCSSFRYAALTAMGFAPCDVESGMSETLGEDMPSTLDWLLMNLPPSSIPSGWVRERNDGTDGAGGAGGTMIKLIVPTKKKKTKKGGTGGTEGDGGGDGGGDGDDLSPLEIARITEGKRVAEEAKAAAAVAAAILAADVLSLKKAEEEAEEKEERRSMKERIIRMANKQEAEERAARAAEKAASASLASEDPAGRYRRLLVELSTTKKEASLAKKAGNKEEQRAFGVRIRELTTETTSCIGRDGLTEAAAMRVKGELDAVVAVVILKIDWKNKDLKGTLPVGDLFMPFLTDLDLRSTTNRFGELHSRNNKALTGEAR